MTSMSKGTRGCYAVAKGRNPGIYMEWKDCEAQVLNFNGAKYRKFLNPADAELWIHQNAGLHVVRKTMVTPSTTAAVSVASLPAPESSSDTKFTPMFLSTPIKESESHSITAPPPVTRGEKVPVPRAPIAARRTTPPAPRAPAAPSDTDTGATTHVYVSTGPLVVYTDGSCHGNGKAGSKAGVGVWWGDSDPRNMCERCPGNQTNNRAELIAIIRVLETAAKDRLLVINTDSVYSMNSMTKWLPGWRARGWKKADGKPILNLPLIKYADILIEERRTIYKQSVELVKVAAHTGIEGNEAADTLANQGAELPALPDHDWDALFRDTRVRITLASSPAEAPRSVPRTVSSAPSVPEPSSKLNTAGSGQATKPSRFTPSPVTQMTVVLGPVQVRTDEVPSPRVLPIEQKPPFAQLSVRSEVHGKPNILISQKELELYAECLLGDEDLIREALEEGVCT